MMAFSLYHGDLMGLPVNDKHLVYKWDKANILFSCTQRGNALSCHFAADKKSLRKLKAAINEWCDFVFSTTNYDTILALTAKESINRLILKCGFKPVIQSKQSLYVRRK